MNAQASSSSSATTPTPAHQAFLPTINYIDKSKLPANLHQLSSFLDQIFPPANYNPSSDPLYYEKLRKWVVPACESCMKDNWKDEGEGNWVQDEKRFELECLMGGKLKGNLRRNAVPMLFMLCRRLSVRPNQTFTPPILLQLVQALISEVPPVELSFAGNRLDWISDDIWKLAKYYNQPQPILLVLHQFAIARGLSHPGRGVLTPGHTTFLEACLNTRELAAALTMLDEPIQDVTISPLDYTHVLNYYYLGGMIYLGLGEFEKARDFFETAVTAPGSSASAIQIAAHKKVVLVQLLLTGKTFTYPKYLSPLMQRAIKGHATVYNDFAEAFQNMDNKKCLELRDNHFGVLQDDANGGLFELVMNSWAKRKLLRLNKTYRKLDLMDVTNLIGSGDAAQTEGLITQLIATRELDGRLLPYITSTGTQSIALEFTDPIERYNNDATVAKLAALKAQTGFRIKGLMMENRRLGMNKDWLQTSVKFESESARDVASALLAGVPANPLDGGRGSTVRGVGANWADVGF